MLARRNKFYEDTSFAADLFFASLVYLLLALFIIKYPDSWSEVLYFFSGGLYEGETISPLDNIVPIFILVFMSIFIGLRVNGYYRLEFYSTLRRRAWASLRGVGCAFLITAFISFLMPPSALNRSMVVAFYGLFLIYHLVKSFLLRLSDKEKILNGKATKSLMVTRASKFYQRMDELQKLNYSALKISAVYFTDNPSPEFRKKVGLPSCTDMDGLKRLLKRMALDVVSLRITHTDANLAHNIIQAAEEQGVEVWFFADLFSGLSSKPEVDNFIGMPVIVYNHAPSLCWQVRIKRFLDICGALAILALLSPLLIASAIAIKLDSKGPIFFRQKRTGYHGNIFEIFKFRTMVTNAESLKKSLMEHNEMTGPVFKMTNDPRITKVGAFLRKYSIDEFPQLINVLRGEMSLVGPRPLPVSETYNMPAFKDKRRLSMPPGMTGLWQISGRSDVTDFDHLVSMDLRYIDSWSLLLDLSILVKTVPAVFASRGAK